MKQEHAYLLSFPENLAFSDQEFYAFCRANSNLNIERNQFNQLIIMSPTGSLSGNHGAKVLTALGIWTQENSGVHFSSSAGFKLADGSIRSPDAAWVSKEKWEPIPDESKTMFAPICPEFIVEIASPSDSLVELKEKMAEWIKNGTKLAWLIEPSTELASVYRSDDTVESINSFDHVLKGEDVLPGFSFDLRNLKS